MILTAVGTILAIGIFWVWFKSRHKNLPPGPSGIPFIGVAHKIDPTGLHNSITQWSKEHGDVIRFKIFGQNIVVLNSFDTIYDALVLRSNDFAGRPSSFRLQVLNDFVDDVVFTTFSPKWLNMKKVSMQTLKMYGANLLVLQDTSLDLIKDMVEELNLVAESGEAIYIKPVLHRCVTAILTSLLYGRKMKKESVSNWLRLEEEGNEIFTHVVSGLLLDIFPWTRYFPLNNLYNKLHQLYQETHQIIANEIQISKETYDPGNIQCFIDGLFKYQSANEGKPTHQQLTTGNLFTIMQNMTTAGAITTSISLTVLVACLVNEKEIQEKLANEIDAVLADRTPCLDDRSSLPYTEATLLEVLRFNTLLPLNLAHATMTDLSIGGYDIPKGTSVFFNLWKVHHDPEFWDEPYEFKPERFLEDGKVVPVDHPNRKRLIAFGAGRRVCPGEVLAKNRMFLMVTSLLQHFVFLPESEDKRPSHDPRTYVFGFNLFPTPFKVKLMKRHEQQ